MFAHCREPVWVSDDFTLCFQHDYLQTLFPLILCGLSLLYLAYELIRDAKNSKYYYAYTLLNNWHHVWDIRMPIPAGAHPDDYAPTDDIDDEIDRNAQLALHPTTSQLNRTTVVEEVKPRGEVLLVFVEVLAVFGELIINILALVNGAWGPKSHIAASASVAVWSYILFLAATRLLLSGSERFTFPGLWYHTAFLYGSEWLITVLLFRSYLIHPPSRLSQTLMIVDFVLVTLLFTISMTSRKGNKTVELEYEGDIPPARESVASVFSLATFSWVDSIVWTGYNKTFELVDVWNLGVKDKAAVVLADYRQFRKTSVLTWHLLKYFKRALLEQAAWAVFSGFLTFVPTLLLRAILQYVENPGDTPRTSAWFFVILLFVSGVAAALSDGQALWIGRHTCIRLRAVIIGEIYSKALKRKAGASTDKVLGAKADAEAAAKPTMVKQALALFKKKKKRNDKKVDTEDQEPAAEGDSQVTAGAIINLMAVDSFKVAECSAYLHFLWASTPVQFVLSIVLLYKTLGPSSLAGVVMMAFLLPVNMVIAQRFAAYQKKILAATDGRIHSTNEVLTNIRIIKYFAWEQRFMASIDEKRVVELARIRTRYILWAISATIWSGSPIVITFFSFFFYTQVEKKMLIPSIAFTALSLFQILRIPLDQLADMVAHVQESKVSVERVEEFLSQEDTQKYKQLRHPETSEAETVIGFENGTFSWGSRTEEQFEASTSFRLMDLNMKFEVGQLNVVAGATGSGKTSLLMALLGEMTLLEGSVYLPGARSREDISRDPETGLAECVAYCAQQAWLVNDTIKQNIVFASPWDPKRYKEVVKACTLQKDFDIMDSGDATLVGEKGVTLSGGQKQRVSLARALYCNARHVLLDDILSAVDSHTAKWIFDHALMGPLMYNRTCVLVTHNISLCLPYSKFSVLLENGRVIAQGSPIDVIGSGKLSQDLTKSTQNSRDPSRVPSVVVSVDSDGPSGGMASMVDEFADDMNGHISGNKATDKHDTPIAGPAKATQTPSSVALQESKATGSVNIRIIFLYLTSMGSWGFWTFTVALFIAQQVASVSTNVWIRQWANSYAQDRYGVVSIQKQLPVTYVKGVNGWSSCIMSGSCTFDLPLLQTQNSNNYTITNATTVDSGYYLAVYAVLGVIFMIVTFLREGVVFYGSLAASKKIHTRLIDSISHAKFRFFDSTPLGQIMNRFSKDIESIDQNIAPVAVGVVHCLFSIITIVVLISVITPGFLIAGVFITILYFLIGKFYINSSRDLKRLESTQRSPLYQQFGETLSGMTTIRAYGDERRFIRENLNRVNTHSRPFIYLWAANRWLAFRVDVAGALVSFFTGIFVVLSVGKIDAGAAGLALTYAVTFTENVLWFVRLYAANEQNMNSVERIKEYLDVEQEAPPIIPENRPPGNWPAQGAVEFKNYSTKYRKDLDLVLRNLTFTIKPCEKIGVVGRTGAGKSSLALALFRALEAEEGQILIDDIDIGLIGLQDLRDSIVMVPQDPTLFTGTIRSNLDPFGLFTDEEIFNALRRVQLIGSNTASQPGSRPMTPLPKITLSTNDTDPSSPLQAISDSDPDSGSTLIDGPGLYSADNKNLFLNLSSAVAESGSNLSQGQRQLLCLARALLKAPKVLLMDEATASIDYATDSKVQDTIRELKDNTIITIAHRLKTIVDYDRVIVMERGRVVEIGEPWELLRPLESEDGVEEGAVDHYDEHEEEQEESGEEAEEEQEEPGEEAGEDAEEEVVGEEAEVDEEEDEEEAEEAEEAEEEEEEEQESPDDDKTHPAEQGKGKRWFREMCEMSGELDVLMQEAKRSWDAKRLVDDR